MRHKRKKETLETIVQKMLYGGCDASFPVLLKLAKQVRCELVEYGEVDFEGVECKKIINEIDWLLGYEDNVRETFKELLSRMEKKIESKESSNSTIMSAIVYYCVLSDILSTTQAADGWEKKVIRFESNKKLENCLEILKRYCPEGIDYQGFSDARRYIRMWDSEFNW